MTSNRRLTDYTPDARNANKGTERGYRMVEDSLQDDGAARSIVVAADGTIVAGNTTHEAAVAAGFEDVIEVETDGRALVVVKRTDWENADDEHARRYAYRDNRSTQVGLTWDAEQIVADLQAGVDLSHSFRDDELQNLVGDALAEPDPDEVTLEDLWAVPPAGDLLFPTDNDWGIPALLPDMQALGVDMPVTKWGTIARTRKMRGTYHFYTDDYKFAGLWQEPERVVASGCVNVVEPNFSTSMQMPGAVALWGIYRKRWLARYWQEAGVRVFVDVNVSRAHDSISLLGVPKGWRAYATRPVHYDLDDVRADYALACEHAGTKDILFLMIGGRGEAKALAQELGAVWIAEDSARARKEAIADG